MIKPKSSRMPRLTFAFIHSHFRAAEVITYNTLIHQRLIFIPMKAATIMLHFRTQQELQQKSNCRKLVHLPLLYSDVRSFKFVIFVITAFMKFKIK